VVEVGVLEAIDVVLRARLVDLEVEVQDFVEDESEGDEGGEQHRDVGEGDRGQATGYYF
jgi:hypothetical protein